MCPVVACIPVQQKSHWSGLAGRRSHAKVRTTATCPATSRDPGRCEHAQMSTCIRSIYVSYSLQSHANNATRHEEICRCLKPLNESKRGGGRSEKRGTVPSCSGSRSPSKVT